MPNYSKMTPLWAKDRAKGDHAKIAKERRAWYAASTTIDEIDNLVSQNEVSLENFEVEDDQKSIELMLYILKCYHKMQCLLKARKEDW